MRNILPVIAIALACAGPAIAGNVAGTSSAVFQNPQASDPSPLGTVTTGIGTSAITFGEGDVVYAPPSALSFAGGTTSGSLETPFKVGTLTFFNGSALGGTAPDSVDLSLTLSFTDPAIPAVDSVFTLDLVNTPNLGVDPDADADYVYFPTTFATNSFVIDGTTYRVALTGFGNIVGDGFLESNSGELHVRENSTVTADLFAVVTAQSGVPEPAAWALMLSGFGMVGCSLRRDRKAVVSFG